MNKVYNYYSKFAAQNHYLYTLFISRA